MKQVDSKLRIGNQLAASLFDRVGRPGERDEDISAKTYLQRPAGFTVTSDQARNLESEFPQRTAHAIHGSYGGAITSVTPRIAALENGSEAVVILDPTGVVWRTTYTEGTGNGWQPWVQVGGVLQDVAAAGVGGQLYLAGKAPNGDLWWWRQAGSQWTWIGNSGVAARALSAAPR